MSEQSAKCVHSIFEKQARERPDAPALVYRSRTLTYRELNAKANQLARFILGRGLPPGGPVGIYMDRSPELVISLLGVLKAGFGYLVLAPDHDAGRLARMLTHAEPPLLLHADAAPAETVLQACRQTPGLLRYDPDQWAQEREDDPGAAGDADALAYVMFTSGSTGSPKGFSVPHRSIPGFILNVRYARFGPGEVFLQYSSTSWDALTLELWTPLLSGGCCVLFPDRELTEGGLENAIRQYGVNTLWVTASFFNHLIDRNPAIFRPVRQLLVGGEELSFPHISKAVSLLPGTQLINGYGPSECTVFACCYPIPADLSTITGGKIPIGRPVGDRRVYVLNARQKLTPVGTTGEIYIGGDAVCLGYLGRDDLNAAKFVPDPFTPGGSGRMYRTGDLGRWRPDGNLEFCGRVDDEVKLRGYRFHLADVDSAFQTYPGLSRTLTLIRQDDRGEAYLCGYYQAAGGPVPVVRLVTYLRDKLPPYMVPARFVYLEDFPLTAHGKVDAAALPAPVFEPQAEEEEAVESSLERTLAGMWAAVLGVDARSIGRNSNFFALGGNSLKAFSLLAQLEQRFQAAVSPASFYQQPTLRHCAEALTRPQRAGSLKIPPAGPSTSAHPLSAAQQRLYFLQQAAPGSTAYNIPYVFEIHGPLERERVNRAANALVRRHESLRVAFVPTGGEVLVQEAPVSGLPVEFVEGGEEALARLVTQFCKPFVLHQAPLLRLVLVSLTPQRHLLLADIHHLIADGLSMKVLIRDFLYLYGGLPLPELKLTYSDFATWQRGELYAEITRRQEAYWLAEFSDQLPALALPGDFPRPGVRQFDGDTAAFAIGPDETRMLKRMAAENGISLFVVLFSLYNVLLSRLSQQEEIVVGTPVAGRNYPDLENIVGLFVNTLAIRTRVQPETRFVEYLHALREKMAGAFDNQEYPFEELVNKVRTGRDPSRNPLFDVSFSFQDFDDAGVAQGLRALDGLTIRKYPFDHPVAKFDLTLTGETAGDALQLVFQYSTALFHPDTIARFVAYFGALVAHVVRDPAVRIADIQMIPAAEQALLLAAASGPGTAYPPGQTLHGLVEEQAALHPAAVAVVFGPARITYADLNARADRLAGYLATRISPGSHVCIRLERSIDLIVAMLGVLKAGAAYVPVDPAYPAERTAFLCADSGAACVIARQEYRESVPPGGLPFIAWEEAMQGPAPTPAPPAPADKAYVIYTSGSTGTPKGVVVGHRSIVNTIGWRRQHYGFSARDKVLQIASFAFDSSVEDIFTALAAGAALVMVPEEKLLDFQFLRDVVRAESVTHFMMVPGLYQLFLDSLPEKEPLPGLRCVTVAGENFGADLVEKHFWKMPRVRLLNEYGPTENSVCTTVHEFSPQDKAVSIGRPIPNVRCYILDRYNGLCPVGVAGELCVAGAGLAQGYWRSPEATGEKFTDNPLRPGERMYRTGDLAKWQPDGSITFLGRMDEQVKIRGYRVETQEVETHLLRHPQVKEAAVLAKAGSAGNSLWAYLVRREPVEPFELRQFLLHRLPSYMVPAVFVFTEALCRLPNGKVDKNSLARAGAPATESSAPAGAPGTPTEERLLTLWKSILETDRIGLSDNFFDLGGNSLKIIKLNNLLRAETGRDIPVVIHFQYPTVSSLAGYLDQAPAAANPAPGRDAEALDTIEETLQSLLNNPEY